MKHLLTTLLLFCIHHSMALNAAIQVKQFYAPSYGSYIETYISVYAPSVYFKRNTHKKLQSRLEVTMVFMQDTTIYKADKYLLNSQEIDSIFQNRFSFSDVQRYRFEAGKYALLLTIKDLNDSTQANVYSDSLAFETEKMEGELVVSNIAPFEKILPSTNEKSMLHKNGFEIIPFISRFYQRNNDSLKYYYEIYDNRPFSNDSIWYLYEYLEHFNSGEVLNNFGNFNRISPKTIQANTGALDLTDLPTGNYNLIIELKNRKNEVIARQKHFFQRYNGNPEIQEAQLQNIIFSNSFVDPMSPADLKFFVAAMYPISLSFDRQFEDRILKADSLDYELMKKFLLSFWQKRSPANPEAGFREYAREVMIAEQEYGSKFRHGYESDRGRIYLEYGKPNNINQYPNEPGAYPYEIWFYAKAKNQTNVRFVFCNRTISSSEYDLIHADAYGEVNNINWRQVIFARSNTLDRRDTENGMPNNFDRNSRLEQNFREN